MTLSAVQICNLALDEIPADPIQSLDDLTIASEVCRRQFPQALGEVMEAGPWDFGRRRQRLTRIGEGNGRYWRHRFAAPADMAMPLGVHCWFDGWSGEPFAGQSHEFSFQDGEVWSLNDDVVLEYITLSPAYAKMSKTFERALALTLGSRLAVPIKRDRDAKQRLMQEAEVFRDRAMARSLNRSPQRYGDDFIPSALQDYDGLGIPGAIIGGASPIEIRTAVPVPAKPAPFDFATYYNDLPEN